MKVRQIFAVLALVAAPAAGLHAQVKAPALPAIYSFSCDSASPLNLTPVSFNFGMQNTLSTGSQSSGAGAGKVTFSTLTVKFKTDKNYLQLLQDVETGAHYSACTLTQTTQSFGRRGGATTTFTWNFSLVVPSSLTVIGSDGSNTNSGGTNVPTGYVEASFMYGAVTAQVSQ